MKGLQKDSRKYKKHSESGSKGFRIRPRIGPKDMDKKTLKTVQKYLERL